MLWLIWADEKCTQYPKNPTSAVNCADVMVDLSWWKVYVHNTPKNPTPTVKCAYVMVDLNRWKVYIIPKKPCVLIVYPKKSHINSKLRLCYGWFELMKSVHNTQKIPVSVFVDPKKTLLAKNFKPKTNPLDPPPPLPPPPPPPVSKICECGPWAYYSVLTWQNICSFKLF